MKTDLLILFETVLFLLVTCQQVEKLHHAEDRLCSIEDKDLGVDESHLCIYSHTDVLLLEAIHCYKSETAAKTVLRVFTK